MEQKKKLIRATPMGGVNHPYLNIDMLHRYKLFQTPYDIYEKETNKLKENNVCEKLYSPVMEKYAAELWTLGTLIPLEILFIPLLLIAALI